MLPVEKCREKLGREALQLSDAEVELLRTQLYSLAQRVVDDVLRVLTREEICIIREGLASGKIITPLTVKATAQQHALRVGPDELCRRLNIGRMTLWRWMKQHRIPFEKHGRKLLFDLTEVDMALKRFRILAAGD